MNLHNKLKELAYSNRMTLNQTCIDLLEKGLREEGIAADGSESDSAIESNINSEQAFIDQMLTSFKERELITILKTTGYVADYVLVFGEQEQIPNDFYQICKSDSIVQALVQIITEQPPSHMWIQIAQKANILWAATPEIQKEFEIQMKKWSEFVV